MTGRRLIAAAMDIAAMAGVAAAIWFWWNPLLRYLPGGLAADVDSVLGWLGAGSGAGDWLGWLGELEWLVGVLLIVAALWLAENMVGAARRRLHSLR